MRGIVFYGTTGKFTWRMLATVLGGEALCIALGALVARGLAATDSTASPTAYLVVGFGLAALAVVAAGTLRRPWGITLGWLVQALTLLSALVVPLMLVVGIFFLTMWVTCLIQGARIDAEVAQREAAAGEADTVAGTAPGPVEAGGSADGPADRVGE
jgi:hypothetical protein